MSSSPEVDAGPEQVVEEAIRVTWHRQGKGYGKLAGSAHCY